jgi:hypothetical protein
LIDRGALIALVTLVISRQSVANAQQVIVRDAGPGTGPQILRAALESSHIVIPPGSGVAMLPRDSVYRSTVIVLGRDGAVSARIHGDLIVVGGDLFIRPGANIDGRAIAFGGAVYPSTLAISGTRLSFRDFTYDVVPTADGFALDYRTLRENASPLLTWPGVYGIQLPRYDRSNGLSLGVGPLISLDTGLVEFRPRITYRSQLGRIDPRVTARLNLDRRNFVDLFAGRETFTNEGWIWSDFFNSVSALGTGTDTRNYYRADRLDLSVHRVWETTTLRLEPFVGAREERSWSVRPDTDAIGGPWSALRRTSVKGMLRPNPQVVPGRLTSLLGGARLVWESQGVRAAATADEEIGLRSPTSRRFAQSTVDGFVTFPTFGTQHYRLDAHIVLTAGRAPPQRFAYLGGASTVSMLELLEQGGDQLLFFDSRYDIPIDRIQFPITGAPTLTLRHIMGAAGLGRLPTLEQRVGVRVAVSIARMEVLTDPAKKRTQLVLGVSVVR